MINFYFFLLFSTTITTSDNASVKTVLKSKSRVFIYVSNDGTLVPQLKQDRRKNLWRIGFHSADLKEFEQALAEISTLESLQCKCQINLIEHVVAALKINRSVRTFGISSKFSNPKKIDTDRILQLVGELLQSNERLKTLNLDDLADGIRDDDSFFQFVNGLRKNTSVTNISMPKIQYTQEQASAFIEAIKERQSILTIDFPSFHTSTESMKALGLFMKANVIKLVKISKRIKNFVVDDLNPVFEALKETTSVTDLTLKLKKYYDRPPQPLLTIDECELFAEALKVNKSLTRLHIHFNGLGSERISIVLSGLQYNRSITEVNFNHNEFNNEIAPAVGSLIRHNKSLTALDLKDINFTAEDCKLIAAGLRMNKTIRNLIVRSVDQTGALSIANALISHQCLRYIELSTVFNIEGYNELYKAIEKNRSLIYMSTRFDKESVSEEMRQKLFDMFSRKRQYRIDTIFNVIIALIQLGRSEQTNVNIFPIEIWLRIFKNIACTAIPSFKHIAEQILMHHVDLQDLTSLCKMRIERVKGKCILVGKNKISK